MRLSNEINFCLFLLFFSNHLLGQTFNGIGNLLIPPGAPVVTVGVTSSTATVSGIGIIGGCVSIDNVTIDLEHTWDGDLGLLLIGPTGQVLELSTDNGGGGNDYKVTVFSDFGPTNIVTGTPPFNGTFKPEGRQTNISPPYPNGGPVGAFTFNNTYTGTNADGDWTLIIDDHLGVDVGILNSWSITFVTNGTGPPANPATIDACDNGSGQADFDLTSVENTVTGGTGASVLWYEDDLETIPINNPTNFTSGPTIVYAVVQGSGCNSLPAPVTLNVVPAPTATPANVTGCDNGNGTATYNLNSVINIVNGGSGNTVSFWEDPTATVPINSPFSYTTAANVVYATVSNGTCESVPVPITLQFDPAPNTGNTFLTIDPLVGCAPLTIDVTFTFPGPGLYTAVFLFGDPTNPGTATHFNLSSGDILTYVINQTTLISMIQVVDQNGCATDLQNPTTFIVNIVDPSEITLLFNPIICEGEFIDLSTTVVTTSGVPITFHSATPPAPANELPTPIVFPLVTTTYYAFLDAGGGCTAEQPIPVTVNQPASPVLGSEQVCEDETNFDLSILLDPSFPNGTWSGSGVVGNTFNASGQSGNVSLTFTPNSGSCALAANTTITILPISVPVLGTADLCSADPAISLTPLADPAFPNGTWSGSGVVGNTFDPTGLAGPVFITFTSSDLCVLDATTTILVTPSDQPFLGVDEICEDYGLYDLGLLLDPLFQSGNWSGVGVTNNFFDPTNLGGGTYPMTFQSDQLCVLAATTTITINELGLPNLQTENICAQSSPFDLTILQDPSFSIGTWSGTGVSGNFFDPFGLSGAVPLVFTPLTSCSLPASTTITINEEPGVFNVVTECSTDHLTYTVNFEITGGDPASYQVNGQPTGAVYQSMPVPSGDPYAFSVDDMNGCGPVVLSGSVNCSCATFSGTMDLSGSPFALCEGQTFTGVFNADENLDPDDLLVFVLHDSPNPALGNILATNSAPEFSFPNGGVLGTTYYLSAVAGSDDGTSNINFNDGCLSVSAGIPISFYQPEISIGSGGSVCGIDCFEFPINFIGVGPYELTYEVTTTNGTFTEVFNSPQQNATLVICPDNYGVSQGEITVQALNFSDDNCSEILQMPAETITVSPHSTSQIFEMLCEGESITVNGNLYDENNPTGTETLIGGNQSGCDSVIQVDLSFVPKPIFNLIETLCEGGSKTVNGTVYDEANPTGSEVLVGASVNGCDSLVNINLTFNNVVTSELNPTLCPGESLLVNNVIYDETNPTGSETFIAGSVLGCDSVVNIALEFTTEVIFDLSETLCAGESILVNNVVYDQTNPTGSELFPAGSASGCDSLVNINLQFNNAASSNLNPMLCEGESLLVNGTTYDDANPTGMEVLTGGSLTGCDSVINVAISFFPAAVSDFSTSICAGETIVFNGTVYGEMNPAGVEVLSNASVNGCDSTVNVSLEILQPSIGLLEQTLCIGGSLIVNGTVYNENNPSGTELLAGASVNGCDSLVEVSLAFNDVVVANFNQTLCEGESLIVNGTIYDESNPTGSETIVGGSAFGCDSIVNISLEFFQTPVGTLSQTLCTGGNLIFNGTVYDEDNPSGTELLMGASANGCDSLVEVSLAFNDAVTEVWDGVLCVGESIDINGTIYDENNPSGIQVFPNGSSFGCDSILEISFGFLPNAFFEINQQLPFGGSITVNGVVYDANNPSGIEFLPNGAINGCDSTIQIVLSFLSNAIAAEVETAPNTCVNETDGSIIVENISGGTGSFFIGLNGPADTPVSDFPFVFNNLSPGNYTINIKDDAGNLTSFAAEVVAAPDLVLDLGDDQQIDLGDNAALFAVTNISPTIIQWEPVTYLSCIDCLDPIVLQPTGDIIYSLYLEDDNGCSATDQVQLFVRKARQVFVPNAFSPNDDGLNDRLTIFTDQDVAKIKSFLIFDRWGNNVFSYFDFLPNDPTYGWDGMYKGQLMQPAVFAYFTEVEFLDGQVQLFEGDVVLVK